MKTTTLMFALFALHTAACADKSQPTAGAHAPSPVERGKLLAETSGCHDCHTPLAMGPNGPAPDMTRALSGHPAALAMPPAPELPPGPWLVTVGATNTAWSGPWGVSFTSNLTPDPETGLGTWKQQQFIDTIRNGRHLGVGRPLLPPMPAAGIAKMSDDDLSALFAYLQSVPAIKNKVPAPIPPKAGPVASK
ncbi:MAG: c-type cytochrome [Deltaproteobacteria bacterium]|nr:c-type cytochrome [Deltaproteobacteria bacterium]MCW5808412.1 c-type cytochrome [Deltaproteobacteria bacterium]